MFWWALFAVGVRVAERVPPRALYALGHGAARILAMLPSAARGRLRRNMSRVTGLALGDGRLDALVRSAYETQVANYLDLLRIRRIAVPDVARRFRLEGPGWQPFLEQARSGKGAVLVTPHFGRIELLNHCLAQFALPTTLPVERLRPQRLFDLVSALRTSTGVHLIPHDAGLRPWLRALSSGHVVALFAEWSPSGEGVPVRFFGAEAHFPPGPAFIALRAGAPLFVGLWLPGETPDTFVAYMEAPLASQRDGSLEEDVRDATQHVASLFEQHIARHPGFWVMFHDVWKGGVSQSAASDPRLGAPTR